MQVIKTIENSIYRDKKGNPVNEILFSVTKIGDAHYLWRGIHKNTEVSHQDCLDVACVGEWEKTYDSSIHKWLGWVYKSEKAALDTINREIKTLKKSYSRSSEILRGIEEAVHSNHLNVKD